MNRRIFIIATFILMILSCKNSDDKTLITSVGLASQQEFLQSLEYSNLVDKETQQEVKQVLTNAGISTEKIATFLENVNHFYEVIGDTKGLVKEGFTISKDLTPDYDESQIITKWEQKYSVFPGYNCRITSFELFNELILIGNPSEGNSSNLFVDEDALETNPKKVFSAQQKSNFLCLFSQVFTENHNDIQKHLQNMKEAFQKREITFKYKDNPNKASLISVIFHSSFSDKPSDNFLFIGHIGILVPTSEGKLFFIEKLAFEEPYQVSKFNNRIELNDYLMNRYDVEQGQPTSKPFIMENDELLKGFRLNPNNIE